MLAIGCDKDDSPSGDGGDTPKSAGDTSVIDAINEQFNSCPLRTPLGTTFDNNDYQKCDFPSLGEAGNSIHEFDGTTYFPAPWIQQIEQGHTDANQSGGITNNWTRTSNFPGAPVGKDGVISVFVEDFNRNHYGKMFANIFIDQHRHDERL